MPMYHDTRRRKAADEVDPFLLDQIDALERGKQVEIIQPAEFSVGDDFKPQVFLEFDELADRLVFDRHERVRLSGIRFDHAEIAIEGAASVDQSIGPKKAANDISAERRIALGHGRMSWFVTRIIGRSAWAATSQCRAQA
jgi:hypothetical protein